MSRSVAKQELHPWEAAGLVLAMTFPAAAAWLYFFTFARAPSMLAIYLGCKLVQFALPLAWVGLGVMPFPGKEQGPGASGDRRQMVAAGLGWGAIMSAVLVAAYALLVRDSSLAATAAPRVAARIEAIGATTPMTFLIMTLLISVVHSFLEEYYWRWLVFDRLRAHLGPIAANPISSLAFAGHHVIVLAAFMGPGRSCWVTLALSLAVVLGGGIWARLYARTGSLLAPWISHVLVDLCILAIGYDLAWSLVQAPATL